jgi:hypothetical protein
MITKTTHKDKLFPMDLFLGLILFVFVVSSLSPVVDQRQDGHRGL